MITNKEREIIELHQKETALFEQARQEIFPNIPQEIYSAFENFLLFIGSYS